MAKLSKEALERRRQFLRDIGKKGGNATKEKHGKKHYQELGKKTQAKRWGIK